MSFYEQGAMKLADTSLQKFRDSAVILSFKAVALEKLGRTEEAFQVEGTRISAFRMMSH